MRWLLRPLCLLLVTAKGTVAIQEAFSCEHQAKCLSWVVGEPARYHAACGGDCQFEVCAVLDLVQCKGSELAVLERACVTTLGVCGSDVPPTSADWQPVRLAHKARMCQIGRGGTILRFPIFDGTNCGEPTPAHEVGGGLQVSCAPRTRDDPPCSKEHQDCVWKVTLPACQPEFHPGLLLAALLSLPLLLAQLLHWLALHYRLALLKAMEDEVSIVQA